MEVMIFSMTVSKEEILQIKLEMENERVGNMPYYNCEICKNKGVVYFAFKGDIHATGCNCLPIRKIVEELERSGIRQEVFGQLTFENFETKEKWQEHFKNYFIKYLDEYKSQPIGFRKWIVVSSPSGYGKTHLCTALLKELIMQGKKGKYMLWKDETPKLMALKKSVSIVSQEKYDELIKEIKNVDVLYIDDFLKLYNERKMEELDLAYEIINSRYINNKITIISTEILKEEFEKIDVATCGRINERCLGYWIQLKDEPDRNYRMKNRR